MKSKIKIKKRKSLLLKRIKFIQRSKKSKLFIGFLVIIASVGLLVLIMPYIPRVRFLIQRPRIDPSSYQQAAKETKAGNNAKTDSTKLGNRLILPDIGVDTQIIEGKNLNVIGKNQGVWRESGSVDPQKDGNIVIAGHRFLYKATNGGWFYNLPELKMGQNIFVKWKDKIYAYEVYRTRTVVPSQIDIRDNDPKVRKKLTLYTCYPLGSTSKRFVVEAKQI